MFETNQVVKDNQEEATPQQSQEEVKPLFGGTDSQGKERLFTSVEEAQKSWQSSQDFIKDKVSETKTMEARIQELEAQLNQSKKLEDALAELKSKEETPVTENTNPQTTESTPQLDVEQIKAQLLEEVMGTLSKTQQAEVYGKNQAESIEAAKSVYGDSYEEKLRETAQELGMSDEEVIKEAQSNPKRFKKLFGLEKQQSKTYAPSGSVNLSSKPKDDSLNFAGGFTDRQRVDTALDNYRKIAQKTGIKLNF